MASSPFKQPAGRIHKRGSGQITMASQTRNRESPRTLHEGNHGHKAFTSGQAPLAPECPGELHLLPVPTALPGCHRRGGPGLMGWLRARRCIGARWFLLASVQKQATRGCSIQLETLPYKQTVLEGLTFSRHFIPKIVTAARKNSNCRSRLHDWWIPIWRHSQMSF